MAPAPPTPTRRRRARAALRAALQPRLRAVLRPGLPRIPPAVPPSLQPGIQPAIFDLRTLPPHQTLGHHLGGELDRIASFRRRRHLRRAPEYRALRPELLRVVRGFAWDQTIARPADPTQPLRAVAWNIERGKRFSALAQVLRDDPRLAEADLLLLTELDIGMGRSGNRDVPAELARLTGMSYVFANQHLVLAPGDRGERDHGLPNHLGLHGCALLSRLPIRRFAAITLPEFVDKYHVEEKRLGAKRALLAELEVGERLLTVAVVHLDPFAPPRHRARQLALILHAAAAFADDHLLLGGDFNTTTYDFGSLPGLALNLTHKFLRYGFEGTLEHYMRPESRFERPVFRALADAGLTTAGFNDESVGTIYYDVNDAEVMAKTLEYVPRPLWAWLQRRLAPRGGVVPLRLDWFAGRGLLPRDAQVIERPSADGVRVSDHNPIVVEIELHPGEPPG